ncbi:hypothetical protein ACFXHA_43500 [Nocardia sp. NPDC059240]|uniref:hypothetical protein n=1 Tax=Nocardia sp. NPDC059240 TaxID=3346786 RepID=UPI0036BB9169
MRDEDTPAPGRAGAGRRIAAWLTGRSAQPHFAVSREAGLQESAAATRLVVIPDSPALRARFGTDRIPFVVDSRLPSAALRIVARYAELHRIDLVDAAPLKRWFTFRSSHTLTRDAAIGHLLSTWPVLVGTCEAYQEAHEAMTAYVFDGDEDKAVAFAKKWSLTIQKRSAVLDGLVAIDWDGVELWHTGKVINALNRHIRTARDNAIPLHRRKIHYQRITYIDNHDIPDAPNPVEDHLTDNDVIGHNPCIDVLLADFTPEESRTVAAYVFNGPQTTWLEAAMLAKADKPGFAERVRRRVKRAAEKHRRTAHSEMCRHADGGRPENAQ